MPLEPLRSGLSAPQAPREVFQDVRSLRGDVLAQELAGDRISSLDAAVTASGSRAADHHQISAHVIPRMLEDMVERQPHRREVHTEADAPAEDALFPLVMERLEQRPITNASLRTRVSYQQPPPAQ